MPDNLSPEDRVRTMRSVKSKLTGPERRLRGMLAGLGISGWRLNYEMAPGKPDVAFPQQKIAIFVDGCFWHACPICNRPLPKTNEEYWSRKIRRNLERDLRYNNELQEAGWKVIRIWEHELKKRSDLSVVAKTITETLNRAEYKESHDVIA